MIIRLAALGERSVTMQSLLAALETEAPLDMDESLLSFGPFFGAEALNSLTARLSQLGLVFFDDFFDVVFDAPPWCKFKAEIVEHAPTGSAD